MRPARWSKVKRNAHRRADVAEAAFGLKAHSGWAALVALGTHGGDLKVLERCRLKLVEESWAKQPYHAAEELKPAEAARVVKRGIDAAKRIALREMQTVVKRTRENGFEVQGCGLLVGDPMPNWSVAEILAVHFRMHKAEGVLFREVLADAAAACDMRLVAIPERLLLEHAEAALAIKASSLLQQIAAFGKSVGAPWGKDQKDAALAAMIALQGQRSV
ncbi:MAG: hypothetical protein ACREA9_16130 [Pyrinomonadaceae bacterium]